MQGQSHFASQNKEVGMYYIGVDLGTSSVKLILMEASGNIVNTVSKSYPIDFPKPGWSEQNPYDWYDKTCEAYRIYS